MNSGPILNYSSVSSAVVMMSLNGMLLMPAALFSLGHLVTHHSQSHYLNNTKLVWMLTSTLPVVVRVKRSSGNTMSETNASSMSRRMMMYSVIHYSTTVYCLDYRSGAVYWLFRNIDIMNPQSPASQASFEGWLRRNTKRNEVW
jgi:hypothetical protein